MYYYSIGDKMKPLHEAFYQYNIEENTEYLKINSDNYKFENLKQGDIIFVSKYKYKYNKPGQYHLFLIIDKYGIYVYGMLITSKIHKDWYLYNIFINKDNTNNLKYNSVIKTDNIYIIEKNNILNKIGHLNSTVLRKCINLNKLQ